MRNELDVNRQTFPSPLIGPREIVHQDKNRQIYKVSAKFDSFTKEYFVSESGQRVRGVVIRGQSALLVRQYRFLIDRLSWEIRGGRVDCGETPERAAIRECLEETGVLCRNLKPLLTFQVDLDSLHNPTHIFFSEDYAMAHDPEPNPQEIWEHRWVSIEQCMEMIFDSQFVDSLSNSGLLVYELVIANPDTGAMRSNNA